MEVLKNTENDLQIDLRPIGCYVIAIASELRKLRPHQSANPLNMGMFMNFPWGGTFLAALLSANMDSERTTVNAGLCSTHF
jgi:hypothetical protein